MKSNVFFLGILLIVACGNKTETQTAAAGNNETASGPLAQAPEVEPHFIPADTSPVVVSQIQSQALGMKLPGKIAFWRSGQLYYMNADGSNQTRRNLVIKDGYGKISWAPDG